MKIQEHIDKISWSMADKATFMVYGFVSILQMTLLAPAAYGLYFLMISLHSWIFVVMDSSLLQNLVQFGMDENNRRRVNLLILIMQWAVGLIIMALMYFLGGQFGQWFDEPELSKLSIAIPILILLTLPKVYGIKLLYRNHDFRSLFFVNLTFFAVMTAFTFYYYFKYGDLTFDRMAYLYYWGSAASSVVAMFVVRRSLKFGLKGTVRIGQMLKFGFPLAINNAFQNFPRQLDVFVIKIFFTTEVVGIYSSAKTLFRVFDEALNASHGMIYPAAVRMITTKNGKGLNDLMTKSVSFLLLAFVGIIIVLELGLSEFIITTFLSDSFKNAVGQFNLLALAALPMPFILLSSIINAHGKSNVVAVFAVISSTLAMLTLYLVSYFGMEDFLPLGIITYGILYGGMCFVYSQKYYNFAGSSLLRAIYDSWYFVRSKIGGNK